MLKKLMFTWEIGKYRTVRRGKKRVGPKFGNLGKACSPQSLKKMSLSCTHL